MNPLKKIPVPKIEGAYRRLYIPGPDRYLGLDTPSFRYGQQYDRWIVNDFTMAKGTDGRWHAYGITHPEPKGFIDGFRFDPDNVHEAENQLFHCSFEGTLADLYREGTACCTEHEKVLYPQEREGDPACWAPCLFKRDKACWLFWSPRQIRAAITEDMFTFRYHPDVLFEGPPMLRDPYVFEENGVYYMLYVHDHLYCRESTDLVHWGEEWVMAHDPFGPGSSQESPCLIRRGDYYYLLWCFYDGQNGCYDERTYVFAAQSLREFDGKAPIAMLEGHAPELLSENGEDYLVSVFYPENGLNIAKLRWDPQD